MDLSVIIVSYNAVDFLKICLHSVYSACHSLKSEVFVVDNNSTDDSVKMVKKAFPQTQLIANNNNPGFSIANNQAIKLAKGKYILILNPDTIVAEDTFTKIVSFLESNTQAGSLGIKMIDGTGSFLPESKRGIPTPWASFCKMSGLSSLFKKSNLFNEYHKGYLSNDKNHPVEILAGAFMCIKKEVIEKVGMFDESFFMYGEDIDLSYRITLAGYKNYYFSDSSIIHFKGESTSKDKIYRDRFYKAMLIFANKHFSKSYGIIYSILIKLGIYFIRFLSVFKKNTYAKVNDNTEDYYIVSPENGINIPPPFKAYTIQPEDICNIENGTLIFPVNHIKFYEMIQIMDDHKTKFKYRFLADNLKTMIGSDKKNTKGQVQHF